MYISGKFPSSATFFIRPYTENAIQTTKPTTFSLFTKSSAGLHWLSLLKDHPFVSFTKKVLPSVQNRSNPFINSRRPNFSPIVPHPA